MPSLIYSSAFADAFKGGINLPVDTIKCMLVAAAYAENKDHTKRSDITNEITGTGYTAGGATATCTVTHDTANDRVDLSLGGINLPGATIAADGAVYYKSRGGLATADELLAYVDFGSTVTSTNAAWALAASTLRIPT